MFGNPNATIYYDVVEQISSGDDPITGEPIWTSTTTREYIKVSIENDTVEPTINKLPGKNLNENFYSGRLCEPLTLPSWYKVSGTYPIELDNGKVGQWYVYQTVTSRFGLEGVFGDRIEGVITI